MLLVLRLIAMFHDLPPPHPAACADGELPDATGVAREVVDPVVDPVVVPGGERTEPPCILLVCEIMSPWPPCGVTWQRPACD